MARRKASAKRGPSYARRLVIMAKRPAMGRVKRRLAREIGATAAVRFYRGSLSRTVLRLAADPRWLTVIALDSIADGAKLLSRKRAALMPQGAGDLGVRMQRLFTRLPPGPVVVVGSDIPSIRAGAYCRGVQAARRGRCRLRAGAGRRLLARRVEAHPARARALRARPLVGAARACRHARQSQGKARRARGALERRRSGGRSAA